MRQMTGKQSISFAKAVYIEGSAAIVGEKEKDGPLGEYFSHTLSDPMCGQESWEEGESELQLATAKLAMQKANVRPEQIRMIFAGDLLAQSIASSFGLVDLNCPLYGLFGACSTMGEALSLGAMAVAGGYGAGGDIEPFWNGGEGVPFSARLRKPAPAVRELDGDGKRRVCAWKNEEQSENHGRYDGKNH